MATKIAQDLIPQNLIGQLLMERYLVLEHLEAGGFSQTYLAIDTEQPDQSCCVLKFMDTHLNPGLDFLSLYRLFEAEAHALGRLQGNRAIAMPYLPVPELIAYCRDRQQVYLVQEFIEGDRLDTWMAQTQQPKPKHVIHTLSEVLLILHQIHSQGIIHCDIKPSNLIQRQRDGKLILIDFGACFLRDFQLLNRQQKSSICQTNQLEVNYTQNFALGTPGYMPSEQAAGYPQFNSDLYSLGMMIIQMITGVAPQQLERYPTSQEWNWHQHIRKPLLNLKLIPILDRLIRIDYRDRYPSAIDAIEALQDLIPQISHSRSSFFRVKLPHRPIHQPEPQIVQAVPTIRKATRPIHSVNPVATPTHPFKLATS